MFVHPECREDEIFIGNVKLSDWNGRRHPDIRWGNISYFPNGDIEKNSYPIFVSKVAYEKVLQKARRN